MVEVLAMEEDVGVTEESLDMGTREEDLEGMTATMMEETLVVEEVDNTMILVTMVASNPTMVL